MYMYVAHVQHWKSKNNCVPMVVLENMHDYNNAYGNLHINARNSVCKLIWQQQILHGSDRFQGWKYGISNMLSRII